MSLLALRNVRAFYGPLQALHGVDLELEAGSITALLGSNGAGKTTTLRAICNMVRVTGTIEFDGRALNGLATEGVARRGIAHVPQGRGTFGHLSVEENLQLGAITRRSRREVDADIARAFEHFPILKERRGQQAGLLSGGQQQMLALARSMMLRPRLLLLDEPSFGLAPLVVRETFDRLEEINRAEGVTVLVVEQNAQIALKVADRAYVIETGRIVMAGPAAEIAASDDVRRSYLGH